MGYIILLFLTYIGISESKLWSKGVVHYAINPKDYDIHSQDEITSTFSALEKEICVKFFNTPFDNNATTTQKVLYINNPNKQKNCPPHYYNYTGSVVDMPIGYRCINKNDIARMAIEMLKASIDPTATPINSFDLVKRFEEKEQAKPRPTFLSTEDRDYINAHYHKECSMLSQRAFEPASRRSGDYGFTLTQDNLNWYHQRVWPLGVVFYKVDLKLQNTREHDLLKFAMTQIELNTCVVFHEVGFEEVIWPKNMIMFGDTGDEDPELGVIRKDQMINLKSFVNGDSGHTAHTINNLMRILGIPMMSNRFDRDNYLSITWSHVKKGKERLLEKTPRAAWVLGIPYDFSSVTHAPANYLCDRCPLGGYTVEPLQDSLWRRLLSMGHTTQLSDSDVILLSLVYDDQCKARKKGTDVS